jgi:hypothetical protein
VASASESKLKNNCYKDPAGVKNQGYPGWVSYSQDGEITVEHISNKNVPTTFVTQNIQPKSDSSPFYTNRDPQAKTVEVNSQTKLPRKDPNYKCEGIKVVTHYARRPELTEFIHI